jgi:hypothetical protein
VKEATTWETHSPKDKSLRRAGGSLTSKSGAYSLTLQDDGNLVLAARGTAVWATGTNGQDVVRAELQTDGNFALYTSDNPVWHTETHVRLVVAK